MQQDGRLVHEIVPMKGHQYSQINSASLQTLFWHTEDAFHPYRADYAVSVSPKRQRPGLYYQLYQDSIGQQEVCRFLRHLLRHLRGHVVVLIDNASMYRGGSVRQLAQEQTRLDVEYFPSYVPELDPNEGVWSWAKTNLANTCPRVVDELIEQVIGKLENIRCSQDLLRGCILQSELPLFYVKSLCYLCRTQ